jgi:hypothetical protein
MYRELIQYAGKVEMPENATCYLLAMGLIRAIHPIPSQIFG